MGLIRGASNGTMWTIKDTEFLLRLINNSSIPGADLEQAADVVKKVKSIHAKLLEIKVD